MISAHHLPFRTDINGLRAWAVLAVLAYHFSYLGLPGGFVGVDIFFVISGYLMTAIILAPQQTQPVSLLTFYAARLRRILPALLVLVGLLLLWGWFALLPNAYQALGEQSAAALGFINNLYLWQSVSYFDVAAHEKWLLHTWSLAVEGQFYLLYPLILWCWLRCGQRLPLLVLLLGLLTLSFAANVVLSLNHQATTAFYWLPTRAWELFAGGLVYALGTKGVRPLYLYWLGWLLIMISLVAFNHQLLWPGYWALLPVIATSLILWVNPSSSWLTQAKPFQWLGNRSYSLYLWHWPMVVALYYVNQAHNVLWVVSALLLSLFMAHLSYLWVERPSQRLLTQWSPLTQILLLSSIAAAVAYFGYQLTNHTWSQRLPQAVLDAAAEANNKPDQRCFVNEQGEGERGCLFGGKPRVIVAGDSHARALRSALMNKDQDTGVIFWGMSGCPTIANALFSPATGRQPQLCKAFNQQLIESLQTQHLGLPLVLISRTSLAVKGFNELINGKPDSRPFVAFEGIPSQGPVFEQAFQEQLVQTACQFAKQRPVYLLRPTPEMGIDVPSAVSKNLMFGIGEPRVSISLSEYHARHRLVWQAQDQAAVQCGVKLLDPLPYLCDSNRCYADHNGRPLYFDDDHLSEWGNQRLVPLFETIFTQENKVTP